MNKSKDKARHTPGPWEIHYGSDGPEIHGEGSRGGLVIADISPEWGGDEMAEANARLIAAAPETTEALADLVEQLEGIGIPDWAGAEGLDITQAKAAIAKAKGE